MQTTTMPVAPAPAAPRPAGSSTTLLAGVLLVSAVGAAFEIGAVRLLALRFAYPLAFLVVSPALLGAAVAGVALWVLRDRLRRWSLRPFSALAVALAWAVLLGALVVLHLPFHLTWSLWSPGSWVTLLAFAAALGSVFFLSGFIVAGALLRFPEQVPSVYGASLAGAAGGSLLALGMFNPMGAAGAILLLAGLALVGALWLARGTGGFAWGVRVVGVATLIGCIIGFDAFRLRFPRDKPLPAMMRQTGQELNETVWNGYSRVDVASGLNVRIAPGISRAYRDMIPDQQTLAEDGRNLTQLTNFRSWIGGRGGARFTDWLPAAAAFHITEARDGALVLAPKGGVDLVAAFYAEVLTILAIEPNGLLGALFDGDVGRHPLYLEAFGGEHVNLVIGSPRTLLHSDDQMFDFILSTSTLREAPAAIGRHGLFENYHFTVEAIRQYLQHLRPGGFLTLTLYDYLPPRHGIRLAATIMAALEDGDAARRILAFRTPATLTYLVKQGALTEVDVARFRTFCEERQFDVAYHPGIAAVQEELAARSPTAAYGRAVQALADPAARAAYIAASLFDVRPPRDDAPFFHQIARWTRVPATMRQLGWRWGVAESNGLLAPLTLALVLLLAAALVLWPLRRACRRHIDSSARAGRRLGYFACIGAGFMGVQVPLVQKLALVLDLPVYAMTTTLVGLLLFAGLGSMAVERWVPVRARTLQRAGQALLGVLLLTLLLVTWPLEWLAGASGTVRMIAMLALTAPIGALLGLFFPLGLRMVQRAAPALAPWAWAIHAAALVLASVAAVVIAMIAGYTCTFALALLCYGLAVRLLRPVMGDGEGGDRG